jgi:hypothetical protein
MSEGGKGAGEGAGGAADDAKPVVMRRLLDEPSGDPLTPRGWAIGLLRRMPAHRASVGRKQRVRMVLGQGARGRRLAVRFLRPAIAGVVLIGCGAAASAALGRWPEIVQAYRRLLAPAAAPTAVADARARRWASGAAARSASPTAAVEIAPTEAPEPAPVGETTTATPTPAPTAGPTTEAPAVVRAPSPASTNRASLHGSSASWRPRRASVRAVAVATKITTRTAAEPAPASAPAAPSDADDTTPVLEAMRALRVEANPVRARRLLAGYLDRHPGGSLAEEALAMSIEAAVAHGDDDAPALARKYVRRYPAGHFSGLARRTLDGAAGTAN